MQAADVRRVLAGAVGFLALASPSAIAAPEAAAPAKPEAIPSADLADLQVVCGTCHTLALVTEHQRIEADWIRVVNKMGDIGLKGTETQFDGAIRYIRQYLTIAPDAAPSRP